jgi:hypothetical protein
MRTLCLLCSIMLTTSLLGSGIPLTNWPAPPTWTPPSQAGLRMEATSVPTGAMPFVGVQPCRVHDSRVGFGGPGPITGNTSRTIDVDGSPCGIPAGAGAYSLNITVAGSASTGGYQYLIAFPTGSSKPAASSLNFMAGAQAGNAAVVPAGTNGDIDVFVSITTEVIIDINGYYSPTLPASNQFSVRADISAAGAVQGLNLSNTINSSGIRGVAGDGSTPVGGLVPAGVRGEGTSGLASGVLGISQYIGAGGVLMSGSTILAQGLLGYSGYAVYGFSSAGAGGYFQSSSIATGAAGVVAQGPGDNGVVNYGLHAANSSTAEQAAAIRAVRGASYNPNTGLGTFGVLAQNQGGPAVFGQSTFRAIQGSFGTVVDGVFQWSGTSGVLGYSATAAVHAFGDITASGSKSFVQPHPYDAGKVIKYVALEGPEAGTYFRGRSRFQGGYISIEVPDHFRMTTAPDGLTVQVTPIGDFAQVAVVEQSLDRIVIKSSKDVEFNYQVNGIRSGASPLVPVQEDVDRFFVPDSAEARLEHVWGKQNRRALVENGTFNTDGSVNLRTAERVGWAAMWREQERIQQEEAARTETPDRPDRKGLIRN